MVKPLFQTTEYQNLMKVHIEESIMYLFNQNQEFAIACSIEHVNFSPELPSDIKNTFNNIVLFVLSSYTYETAKLEDEYLYFDAGFGADNFSSTVSVPLLAIKQLFVDDNPILLNQSEHINKEINADIHKENSMKALLNNPKNKKLLKKKKL
jgi:hypothetical protein